MAIARGRAVGTLCSGAGEVRVHSAYVASVLNETFISTPSGVVQRIMPGNAGDTAGLADDAPMNGYQYRRTPTVNSVPSAETAPDSL